MQETKRHRHAIDGRGIALVLATIALLIGMLYYAVCRQAPLSPLLHHLLGGAFEFTTPLDTKASLNWFPSLVHAFATMVFFQALVPCTGVYRHLCNGALLVSLLALELSVGTVAAGDLLAVLAGYALARYVAHHLLREARASAVGFSAPQSRLSRMLRTRSLAGCLVIGTSALLAAGSYSGTGYSECARYDESNYCIEYKRPAVPVYMSYQELRNAIVMEAPRSPDRLGRVYLYRNFIFLNEINQGLHVVDNSNPAAPINRAFIRIPGNTEVAIRDDYLYANSYVDLVTLSVTDTGSMEVVSRQEDIFPYDAVQNIPYNISLSRVDIDPSQGVIVAYQLSEE